MKRRTKIICTIGPASSSPEMIRALIRAGMNLARINFSYGDHATKAEAIATIRRIADEECRLVGILADLQGPKLRVGALPLEGMELIQGATVRLCAGEPASVDTVPVPHPGLLRDLREGQRVLFDDGALEVQVIDVGDGCVKSRVVTGGRLMARKGINVPGGSLSMSAVTAKDREDLAFAIQQKADFVALSFVRRPSDICELRQLVEHAKADMAIIAKIEKPEALDAFDSILEEADAVMVARGDLGVETPAEEVPFHQKRIIRACNRVGKPVITATQMLQTMIESPYPTRAEASDVANAILDGTDAVMLSGETAVGHYPVEAVETMARICLHAESHELPGAPIETAPEGPSSITRAISAAAVQIARGLDAKAIVTPTMSGTTARMVARHRPPMPIVAMTPNRTTLRHLALVWGVTPVLVPEPETTDVLIAGMLARVQDLGLAGWGERIVLTAGIPFGGGGETNTLQVHTVGRR
ncbi:pyruvate kinase [Candidatus Fermentibacteria bacterium]|nr:pyruvate kinase [Candidatus Fermentibacteria bacterium]